MRMEIGRSVVTFDYGNSSPGPKYRREGSQGVGGTAQVLKDEADKDVIEGSRAEGQGEDIGLSELNIGETGAVSSATGFPKRVNGHIDGRELGAGTPVGKRVRLRTHAASRLEHRAAGRVRRIRVQQVAQGTRLILEALTLS